jgi:hypothetical protein
MSATATAIPTRKTATGRAYDYAHLLSVAQYLAGRKADGDRDGFLQSCAGMGLDEAIIPEVLDLLSVSTPRDHSKAKSNTDLTSALGIQLDSKGLYPRNYLLYLLLAANHPDLFQINLRPGPHVGGSAARGDTTRRNMQIVKGPTTVGGDPMPVYKLFKGHQPAEFEAAVGIRSRPLCSALGDALGLEFGQRLLDLQMLIPPSEVCALLAKVLERGRNGEEIVISGAFCPDYAYEETGDPNVPYRYTFNGLGDGIGLVAQQFLRVTPGLSAFFTKIGIRHRFVLGIGDFEADTVANLERVGVSDAEFRTRCERSLHAFRQQIGNDLPLELEMFDRDRGQGRLRPLASSALERLRRGDYGRCPELYPSFPAKLARVGKDYRTFYSRWEGRDLTELEVHDKVLVQGSEYAAMGAILREDFGPNTIILSGDRPQMHLFDSFSAPDLPVLCVKRAY